MQEDLSGTGPIYKIRYIPSQQFRDCYSYMRTWFNTGGWLFRIPYSVSVVHQDTRELARSIQDEGLVVARVRGHCVLIGHDVALCILGVWFHRHCEAITLWGAATVSCEE